VLNDHLLQKFNACKMDLMLNEIFLQKYPDPDPNNH